MTKLTRFFGICLLVVSFSAVALADGEGGITQTPPAPVANGEVLTDSLAPTWDSVVDGSWVDEVVTDWLLASIR